MNPYIQQYQNHPEVFANCNAIAFDIFDTILYRNVPPKQVYYKWAKRVIAFYGLKLPTSRLVSYRISAERWARMRNYRYGFDRETTFFEIIALVYKRLSRHIAVSFDEFYDQALQIERNVEKSVIYVSNDWVDFVKLLQDLRPDISVYCISDFYLPKDEINKWFDSLQIGVYISDFYISCDYKRSKSSGRLYQLFLEHTALQPSQICMFGDNENSDIKNAQAYGLHAFSVANQKQQEYYKNYNTRLKSDLSLDQLLKSKEIKSREKPFAFVAFILFPFIERLYHQLSEAGCKEVFFLSREGELLKKLFELYQQCIGDCSIQTHYLCVSRKATLMLGMTKPELLDFSSLFSYRTSNSPAGFLRNIGLDNSVLSDLTGIDPYQVVPNFYTSDVYARITKNPKFIEACLSIAHEQSSNFERYFSEFARQDEKNLFIVDIGYSGTMQHNLSRYFTAKDKTCKIQGFYMFYLKNNSTQVNSKTGLLFDSNICLKSNIFMFNYSVLETLLSASHGSTLCYQQGKPVLNKNSEELHAYQQIIGPFQQNIITLFEKITACVHHNCLSESEYIKSFEKLYAKFILNPTIAEINQYSLIPILDNFADFKEYRINLKKKRGIRRALKSLQELVLTRGSMLRQQNTNWVPVIFYHLNLQFINSLLYAIRGRAVSIFAFIEKKKKKG